MKTQENHWIKKRLPWVLGSLGVLTGLIAILIGIRRKRRAQKPTVTTVQPSLPVPPPLVGLSEDEAESRRLKGQDNVIIFEPPRSPKDIVRDNTLTIFNLSLVGVAFVQFLLGLYWDTLLSLGVAALNIGLNVFQEILATRRLQDLEQATRPHATVIREGKARSIDPSDIVREDVLVTGPGDQFLADGEILSKNPILVDESILTGKDHRLTKRFGDPVLAGSFCVSGRAFYRAQKIGEERMVAGLLRDKQSKADERTPLEKIVERVLRVMLLLVVVMVSLILSNYLRLDSAIGLDSDVIVSRISVIFSLAPASLYFMIFLNYVGSVRQLAKQGALVHRTRSVETLAQASILCVSLTGSRAGIDVQVEDISPPDGNKTIAESRLRQILGDFGCTSNSNDQAVLTLADLFSGDKRFVQEQSPFLSVYGWAGVAFDEDDLRGVYILGEPQLLENNLVIERHVDDKEVDDEKSQTSGFLDRFSVFKRFRRHSTSEEEQEEQRIEEKEPSLTTEDKQNLQEDINQKPEPPKEGRVRKFFSRIGQTFRRDQKIGENQEESKPDVKIEEPKDEVVFLFAYYPELVPLHDSDGQPQLPQDLIPLCNLHYSARVNPETINTIRTLRNNGVVTKVFSPGDPGRVLDLLAQAGVGQGDSNELALTTGPELVDLDERALYQATNEKTIFGYVNSEQTRRMIATLHDHGDTVVVFANSPSDLPIMQDANLSITSQGSSQAALGTADIVLLKESPQALLTVLEKGQSVVRSLLDVLKLYLTQLAYLPILIFALWALGLGFPYRSQQGAFIAIATLTLPSLGLSLWEIPGALAGTNLNRHLVWFAGPAALLISTLGVIVYAYFLNQSNQMAYAQMALTHMLVISGLVLSVMVRPPKRSRFNGGETGKDWRTTILAVALLVTYLVVSSIPIAYQWFRLTHLSQPGDYLIVGLAVLTWAVIVQIIWRFIPPDSIKKN